MNKLYCFLCFMLLEGGLLASDQWNSFWPLGEYMGYGEGYSVNGGSYVVEGDSGLGSECHLELKKEGVVFEGRLFTWDRQGFRASRQTKDGGSEVIVFRARIGNVVVADLLFEGSESEVKGMIRMSIALAPDKPLAHEETHALGGDK